MEDESDSLTSGEPHVRQSRLFSDLTAAKKAALTRTAKWREDKARTVWPPAPVGFAEPVTEKPTRKPSNPILDVIAVVFMTFWALLTGYISGTGHKDFSESLVGNIAYALFDLLLWSVPILYWFGVLRSRWRLLKIEPTAIRKVAFAVSSAVLIAVYGTGLWISLICLVHRAAASDTTY